MLERRGRLAGKRALVTGSTRGLGEAIATMFAEEEAQVSVTGRSAEDGARVVAAITEAGGEADFVRLDLGDEQSIAAAVDAAAARWGGLDVLVNNAAPTAVISGAGGHYSDRGDAPVDEICTETWRSITGPAIDGLASTLRYAIPHLKKSGAASIVNVSSISSLLGMARFSAYVTTKGAMNALTRSVAADYAPGIRCNALVSGSHESAAMAPTLEIPGMREAFESICLMRRIGHPRELAYAATFFASDESSYITGTCLPVDGGQSIHFAIPYVEADETANAMAGES